MIDTLSAGLKRWVGSSDPSIDHYELRYRPFDGRGWRRLDSLNLETELSSEFDTPPARDAITPALEVDDLPAGVYRLYPIRTDGTMAESEWKIEFRDPENPL
ncbi:hypothetical protein BRD00_11155 [Halobacteriales archaeon QS_8_69_26]|nr:MAG: hypothetical protein BRD00_11155 [Halobacteriales archaeon QS_8_69_26]